MYIDIDAEKAVEMLAAAGLGARVTDIWYGVPDGYVRSYVDVDAGEVLLDAGDYADYIFTAAATMGMDVRARLERADPDAPDDVISARVQETVQAIAARQWSPGVLVREIIDV